MDGVVIDYFLPLDRKLIILWKEVDTIREPFKELSGLGKLRRRATDFIAKKYELEVLELFSGGIDKSSVMQVVQAIKADLSIEDISNLLPELKLHPKKKSFLKQKNEAFKENIHNDEEETPEFYKNYYSDDEELENEASLESKETFSEYEEILRSNIFDDFYSIADNEN